MMQKEREIGVEKSVSLVECIPPATEVEVVEREQEKEALKHGRLFEESKTPQWWPAMLLAPMILPLFVRYSVVVEKDGTLSFGYVSPLVRKKLKREEIAKFEAVFVESPSREWGGWGIRFNSSGHVGYICNGGNSMRIETTSGHVYVFTCDGAEKLVKVLHDLA